MKMMFEPCEISRLNQNVEAYVASLPEQQPTGFGKAVGSFLPGYLSLMEKKQMPGFPEAMSKMGFKDIGEFKEFTRCCLGDICISSDDEDKMIQEILETPRKLLSVPFNASESDIRNIIQDIN